MTDYTATVIAMIIHFLFRVSIFLDIPKESCTSVLGMSSFMILLTTVMFLNDVEIFPERYKISAPKIISIFIETVLSLFIIEVVVVLIWSKIEYLIEYLFKLVLMEENLNLYDEMGGDNLVGLIITILSSTILAYASLATNSLNKFLIRAIILKEVAEKYFHNAFRSQKNAVIGDHNQQLQNHLNNGAGGMNSEINKSTQNCGDNQGKRCRRVCCENCYEC